MKNIYLTFLLALTFSLNSLNVYSQATAVVPYTGFMACGGCLVCGQDYWCINTSPSYCGATPSCESRTFADPIPSGYVATSVTVNFYSAGCVGSSMSATINGQSVPTVNDANTGCLCDAAPCAVAATSSNNYPCGLPGYIYGGANTLQLCTGTSVCVNRVELTFTYVLPDVITPNVTPSSSSFCSGGSVGLDAGVGYSAYIWTTGATTQTITATTAGVYTVSVTSTTGCTTGSSSAVVNVYAPPNPIITPYGPTTFCIGTNLTLDAGSGYSAYSWSTGSTTETTTINSAGTYTITVTDVNGCTGTNSITTYTNDNPIVSGTSTDAGCSVANGTATANPSGGAPGYTYSWSNTQTTQTITGLSAGTYGVTITDTNGCTASTPVTVNGANAPSLTTSTTSTGCTVANGTATANATGGTPGYTYQWSDAQITQTATGLAAGTYFVTVTDTNGCIAVTSANISVSASPLVTVVGNPTGCTVNNGSAVATPNGGTPPFTYLWNNGLTTDTVNGLALGTYTITITDANGCTATNSVNITVASNPTVITSVLSNDSCNGDNNGSAIANVSGGLPNYTYSWSNSQTTPSATGLIAGSYTVIVTDANGCTSSSSVTITQPSVLTDTITTSNINCYNDSNGTATIIPSGGTPSYNYLWDNGITSQFVNNLTAGTHSVTLTDANGCQSITSFNITQPSQLIITPLQTNILCFGESNGTATANPTGGTPTYTYLWNPSAQTTQTATGLSIGNYTVTVTDAKGCSTTQTYIITQPQFLASGILSFTNVICNNGNTGEATILATGGTPNYTYLWSNSQSSATATNLSAGIYYVTIRDANNCFTTSSVTITEPTAILASITSITNPTCYGGNDGSIISSVSGGTPSYAYLWNSNPQQTTANATNLNSGNYSLTITDTNNCTRTIDTTLVSPLPIIVTSSQGIDANNMGFIDITVNNGVSPISYSWSNFALTQDINNINTGTYIVTITDADSCFVTDTFNIDIPFLPLEIPNAITPNNDNINDDFEIKNIDQYTKVSLEIFNRWGDLIFLFSGNGALYADRTYRWNGRYKGKDLPMGGYVFILKINGVDPINGVVSIVR
ncbi:MAG: hypothetical protein A2X08_10185 [Bacteroidetes bacterium GWA2_32_17]|nr:MAG: hypothetical protein A2X08_10185 [Bacteroidetes bacterium GWA2_32_17]